MAKPGRPLKEESEEMAFIEEGIATLQRMERYAERRWVAKGRKPDKHAMEECGRVLKEWRKIRSRCYRQGLLFEGNREEDG